MKWRKPTEEEANLYRALCGTCLITDRWGNIVIDDEKVEEQWVKSGKTKAELVNTFAHLKCKAIMDVQVNDIIQMSTRKSIPDCYRVAEISFEDNRIRFYQNTGVNVMFNEVWPINRYPYLGIESKANERKLTKEEKRNNQTELF